MEMDMMLIVHTELSNAGEDMISKISVHYTIVQTLINYRRDLEQYPM